MAESKELNREFTSVIAVSAVTISTLLSEICEASKFICFTCSSIFLDIDSLFKTNSLSSFSKAERLFLSSITFSSFSFAVFFLSSISFSASVSVESRLNFSLFNLAIVSLLCSISFLITDI